MQIESLQSCSQFGVARADITPPVGIYHRMWGAAVHDQSEGVHRPLTATAIYFGERGVARSAETEQLLFAIDHCLLATEEVQQMIGHVAKISGVATAAITLTFSHTHAAGLLHRSRADLPGGELIGPYLDELTQTLGTLAQSAIASARVTHLLYGQGRCRLAAARDLYDSEMDEFLCGFNPDEVPDDTLVVARATDEQGTIVATIVNYACHPTTLAWQNRLISPDYPGAMREVVEQATGAPCIFLQGASGDLGPVEGFVGDTAVADRNGRQLGYAALCALESLPPPNTLYRYAGKVVSGASIGTWERVAEPEAMQQSHAYWRCERPTVELPYRHDLPKLVDVERDQKKFAAAERQARANNDPSATREARAMVERTTRMIERLRAMPSGPMYPFTTTVLRMGAAIWVLVPGEPYSLLQESLRDEFFGHPLIIVTLANGWGPSYIPPRETYGQGIYQESIAALAPGSLESLIESISDRIDTLLHAT